MVSGGFRLDLLLETARLARSTYYYQLKQLDGHDKDKETKGEIQEIYYEHKGNYGYRRITLELRNRGFVVNQKKVQRLMKLLGLSSQIRQSRKQIFLHTNGKVLHDVTEFAIPVAHKIVFIAVLDGLTAKLSLIIFTSPT